MVINGLNNGDKRYTLTATSNKAPPCAFGCPEPLPVPTATSAAMPACAPMALVGHINSATITYRVHWREMRTLLFSNVCSRANLLFTCIRFYARLRDRSKLSGNIQHSSPGTLAWDLRVQRESQCGPRHLRLLQVTGSANACADIRIRRVPIGDIAASATAYPDVPECGNIHARSSEVRCFGATAAPAARDAPRACPHDHESP